MTAREISAAFAIILGYLTICGFAVFGVAALIGGVCS